MTLEERERLAKLERLADIRAEEMFTRHPRRRDISQQNYEGQEWQEVQHDNAVAVDLRNERENDN